MTSCGGGQRQQRRAKPHGSGAATGPANSAARRSFHDTLHPGIVTATTLSRKGVADLLEKESRIIGGHSQSSVIGGRVSLKY